MKVSIIGGTGEFGSLFARVFKEEGNEVLITGRRKARGLKVAEKLRVSYTSDNVKAARWGEVVVVSVSIENTLEVIEEVAPEVNEGSVLMDFTSVKAEPCRLMASLAREGVEVIGTHPMFGPRVTSFEGMVFILTPVRASYWLQWLRAWLKEKKARVIETTPEEHDRVISVVQGMTHFIYIASASALAELDLDVKETRRFSSPIYELMLDLIARIVGQNPSLYAGIQMLNPQVKRVHRSFIAEAQELSRIVEEKDREAFVEKMVRAAKHLGDLEAAMGRSDKAIRALTAELRRLEESLGREVALKHIYTGRVHVGTVESVDSERVTLARGRRMTELKVSNVELLGEEELERWKLEHLPREKRDISVLLSNGASGETLCQFLEKKLGAAECRVLDVYRGENLPARMKSITIRVEGVVGMDFAEAERLLRGIGGRIR